MAKLGFRTINEMVGRVDKLKIHKAVDHWKAKGLDLTPLLQVPDVGPEIARYCVQKQDHGLADVLDNKLIELCKPAIGEERESHARPADQKCEPHGRDDALQPRGEDSMGLRDCREDTITIKFSGSAGQSFGAFLSRGITLILEGESNDYLGKGLSGGKIMVFPPKQAIYSPEETILIGNTSLYGGTQGEAYCYGMAGERFAVRNSGVQGGRRRNRRSRLRVYDRRGGRRLRPDGTKLCGRYVGRRGVCAERTRTNSNRAATSAWWSWKR